MSTKTDYVDEEWMHLRRAPFIVAAGITISDPGGPIELAHETTAALKAAASPRMTLAPMSSPAEDAYAQASEPRPNSVSAASSRRLRPKRSPSNPAGSIIAPRTNR